MVAEEQHSAGPRKAAHVAGVALQMYNAFALIVCAWAATKWPGVTANTRAAESS